MLSCCLPPRPPPSSSGREGENANGNPASDVFTPRTSALSPIASAVMVAAATAAPSDRLTADAPFQTNQIGEGTMIKQYKLQGLLGEGMQGQVRMAIDPDNRQWAIKIIRKRAVFRRGKEGKFGLATGPIAREIAIMKKLAHPNLVALHEVLDDPNEDKLFLVMELISGGPVMQDKLDGQEPLPEDLARSYFRQLILGLEYLHYHGVVHRDIKPSNLLVTNRGALKISDFGVSMLCKQRDEAVAADERDERGAGTTLNTSGDAVAGPGIPSLPSSPGPVDGDVLSDGDLEDLHTLDLDNVLSQPIAQTPLPTRRFAETPLPPVTPGKLLRFTIRERAKLDDTVDGATGTAAFLPPEACVLGGAKYGGMSADLWAAGVTLYMFLYGRVPFLSESQEELFTLIREQEVEFPVEMGRKPISSDAVALLRSMLQKNPSRRPGIPKIKRSKWVLKEGGKMPTLSRAETRNIQVTTAEVESAVTHVDLSVAVRLMVRSKSWSTKVQDRVQHNALLRAEIENLGGKPRFMSPDSSGISSADKSALNSSTVSGPARLMLDVTSPELMDGKGKPKQPRALTMPAPRELRKDTGGLVNEFKMKMERPAQTPTALLEEIRRLKSSKLSKNQSSSESPTKTKDSRSVMSSEDEDDRSVASKKLTTQASSENSSLALV